MLDPEMLDAFEKAVKYFNNADLDMEQIVEGKKLASIQLENVGVIICNKSMQNNILRTIMTIQEDPELRKRFGLDVNKVNKEIQDLEQQWNN